MCGELATIASVLSEFSLNLFVHFQAFILAIYAYRRLTPRPFKFLKWENWWFVRDNRPIKLRCRSACRPTQNSQTQFHVADFATADPGQIANPRLHTLRCVCVIKVDAIRLHLLITFRLFVARELLWKPDTNDLLCNIFWHKRNIQHRVIWL